MGCAPTESAVTLKEYAPLISPVVLILLFIIERIIGAQLRKKQVRREWYFKVIVEPSLKSIHDFFQSASTSMKASIDTLVQGQATPHNQYLTLKATQIGAFQTLKRSFDIQFISI